MSHFGDLVWNTLSLVGLGTLVWLFVVCWCKARYALRARRKPITLDQLKAKWQGVALEQH